MPCRTDYMEPNKREKEAARVLLLLEEVASCLHVNSVEYRRGMHELSYNKDIPQSKLDKWTAELCQAISNFSRVQLNNSSLELQMWWRDHQEIDRERLEKEAKERKQKELAASAISKLSGPELEALRKRGLQW